MNDNIDNTRKSSGFSPFQQQKDKVVEVDWWKQTTSSAANPVEESTGLWDGLFLEKDSVFSADANNVFEFESASEGGNTSKNVKDSLEEQMESLSISASIPFQSPSKARNDKPSTSAITENSDLSMKESSASLTSSQAISDMTVHLDYARLKAEHRKLKKYFENVCENRYKTPPISETIRRLNRNEPVALDYYKSHSEKMELLDAGLEHCDWDSVVAVLLFIKRTLSNLLFRQCLIERPVAAQHYVTYLREAKDTRELVDTLFGLGQTAEAAMVEFEVASKLTDPKRKLEALRNCLLSGFSDPKLANERRHLEEWIGLLEAHMKKP